MCLLDKSVVQEHYRLYYRQAWLISKDTRPSRLPAHFIHSLTHSSSSSSSRARLWYIYIIITPKKSQKQTKLSCACWGRAETFIALLYSHFLGAHTHRSPPTESRIEPNRFFRNRNFPQNRFLSLALYSPIRCPMHILVLTWREELALKPKQSTFLGFDVLDVLSPTCATFKILIQTLTKSQILTTHLKPQLKSSDSTLPFPRTWTEHIFWFLFLEPDQQGNSKILNPTSSTFTEENPAKFLDISLKTLPEVQNYKFLSIIQSKEALTGTGKSHVPTMASESTTRTSYHFKLSSANVLILDAALLQDATFHAHLGDRTSELREPRTWFFVQRL